MGKFFFHEIEKNIGLTVAQKSKETRVGMKDGNGINLCSANNPYIIILCQVASDYSAVMCSVMFPFALSLSRIDKYKRL